MNTRKELIMALIKPPKPLTDEEWKKHCEETSKWVKEQKALLKEVMNKPISEEAKRIRYATR